MRRRSTATSRSRPEKLSHPASNKFPELHRTRRFNISLPDFTSAISCRHSESAEPTTHLSIRALSLSFITILTCTPRAHPFPTKILQAFLFSLIRATSVHLILLDPITIILHEEYYNEVQRYEVFSSIVLLTIPDPLLTSLLSNALDVRHQVSHPYKTDKITAPYIFIFLFLGSKLENGRKIVDRMAASSFLNQPDLNFSSMPVFTCYHRSTICERCHISNGFVDRFYVMLYSTLLTIKTYFILITLIPSPNDCK